MEVSGKLNAPAALYPEKEPQLPGERKNPLIFHSRVESREVRILKLNHHASGLITRSGLVIIVDDLIHGVRACNRASVKLEAITNQEWKYVFHSAIIKYTLFSQKFLITKYIFE